MAVNEKSQKFWCGENDKVTIWGLRGGGVRGRMREYGKFRGVWRSMDGGGIGKFLVVWGVGSSKGEHGRSEEVWKKEWVNVLG